MTPLKYFVAIVQTSNGTTTIIQADDHQTLLDRAMERIGFHAWSYLKWKIHGSPGFAAAGSPAHYCLSQTAFTGADNHQTVYLRATDELNDDERALWVPQMLAVTRVTPPVEPVKVNYGRFGFKRIQ